MAREINLLDANLSAEDKLLVRQLIQRELIEGKHVKLRHKETYTFKDEEIKLSHSIGKSGNHYSIYARGTQRLGEGSYGTVKPIYDLELTPSSFTLHKSPSTSTVKKVVKVQKSEPFSPKEKEASEKYYGTPIYHSIRPGDNRSYLILPEVSGMTLSAFIKSDGFKKLTYAERVTLAKSIVNELITFHEKTGLGHNDLSATNIMYDPQTKAVRLIDFGKSSDSYNTDDSIFGIVNHYLQLNNIIQPIQEKDKVFFKALQERLEALEKITSLPENDLITTIHANTHPEFAPLYYIALSQPALLKKILASYSEQERLSALQYKDHKNNTSLHYAANYPESLQAILSFLPENDRVAAVKIKSKLIEQTPLHDAAHHPESLNVMLGFLPEQERLAALQIKNWFQQTPLYYAATDHPVECLKMIFTLLPEKDQFAAVHTMDEKGQSLLVKLDKCFSEDAFSGTAPSKGLFILFLALDSVKPFLQSTQPSSATFFNSNDAVTKSADELRLKLYKCTTEEMVRETIIQFLSTNKDDPTKIQIALLEKLIGYKLATLKDYNQQLADLSQRLKTEFETLNPTKRM